MSAIGGEIGTLAGGGPNNSRFGAGGANILQPTTIEQANTAYGTAQDALSQQAQLAQALQAQGTQGMASQSQLAQALQQQALGQGPNPAQAQLAQATGANVANQAALMAGQRGASSNVGLIARQAAEQGANTQQQAVGQSASMQAQQQLAAQQQLQNLAASQIGQQGSAVGAYNQAAQGEQGNILNSINAQNNANVSMQSNMNNANSGMAQTNANNSAGAIGGAMNSLGGAVGLFAAGGEVKDPGFYKSNPKLEKVSAKDSMPLPDHIKGMADIYHPNFAYGGPVVSVGPSANEGNPNAISNASPLGKSQGKQKPEEEKKEQPGTLVTMVAKDGGSVPGKARVKGDSEENDTVNAKLSPGEIVIPRHITQGKDAPEKAKKFVEQELAKHLSKNNSGDEESDFKEALKMAIKSRKKS